MGFIKTPGKLPPDDDARISHTSSSKTTNIATIDNNAVLCKRCRLCKRDVAISAYSPENSPYCPDCENALGEMITWWNDVARVWWVKSNAKNTKKDRE
jgi:hypothetical protein